MMNGSRVPSYSLRSGEAIKESVVCESTELPVERVEVVSQARATSALAEVGLTCETSVEDGESMAMPNEFYKQCHV